MAIKIYTFTVSGYSSFPADMLRYDKCWPVDSDSIDNVYGKFVFDGGRRTVKVKLSSHFHPTIARWESFGWSVSDVKKGLI